VRGRCLRQSERTNPGASPPAGPAQAEADTDHWLKIYLTLQSACRDLSGSTLLSRPFNPWCTVSVSDEAMKYPKGDPKWNYQEETRDANYATKRSGACWFLVGHWHGAHESELSLPRSSDVNLSTIDSHLRGWRKGLILAYKGGWRLP
jgi:hypothetical protein